MARITKAAKLCYILRVSGPLTRVDAMRRLHALDGCQGRFARESNVDYFKPRVRYDGWMSPVARGLIVVVKRTRRGIVYAVSDTGRELVDVTYDLPKAV